LIDIHCHILPGLDDGAKTINESLEIAGKLVEIGYTTVIATPHVLEGREFVTAGQIRKSVIHLNEVLEEQSIPLKVLPGAEIFIFPDLAEWFSKGRLLSLAETNKYILIELPMLSVPHYTEQVFFNLQVLGLTPIVAHPERNREIQNTSNLLAEWSKKGVRVQANIGSFQGKYGLKVKKFAEELFANGIIDFLGSDFHESHTGLNLRSTTQYLGEFGARLTAAITENPTSILEGQSLMPKQIYNRYHLNKERKLKNIVRGLWNRGVSEQC